MAVWHGKIYGGYSRDSDEAYDNAVMIFQYLTDKGWTVNAVSGVLGNFEYESGYNPWRWQSDDVLLSTDTDTIANSTEHGYGLAQFTPAGKYINSIYAKGYAGYAPNFLDMSGKPSDGEAQIMFIDEHADYAQTNGFPITYSEFKQSTQTPEYLAAAWLMNYERPADPSASIQYRQEAAKYWFDKLGGLPSNRKGMPLWMYLFPY